MACRALQKQALQEAGQISKVHQLELGVQQAALDHERLEQELAVLLQDLNLEPAASTSRLPWQLTSPMTPMHASQLMSYWLCGYYAHAMSLTLNSWMAC